jgi:hypothetical protein
VKVYYAHCLALYGKPQEERDTTILRALGFEVVNPNAPEHAAGYQREGMDYFRRFAKECDAVAFRALADGAIPAGVAEEVHAFRVESKPVIELPSGMERRALSVAATREYLRESGQR